MCSFLFNFNIGFTGICWFFNVSGTDSIFFGTNLPEYRGRDAASKPVYSGPFVWKCSRFLTAIKFEWLTTCTLVHTLLLRHHSNLARSDFCLYYDHLYQNLLPLNFIKKITVTLTGQGYFEAEKSLILAFELTIEFHCEPLNLNCINLRAVSLTNKVCLVGLDQYTSS